MDKLDLEKPWGTLGQIALIAAVIGIIYLFFRWAVVVPEWGWRLILVATAAGTLLYFGLSVRGSRRKEERPPRPALRAALTVILVAVLMLPAWVLLYLWLFGAELP